MHFPTMSNSKFLKHATETLGPELIKTQEKNSDKNSPPSQSRDSNLAPIVPQHATVQPTKLSLKERHAALSGDDARIKDSKGNTVFQMRSEMLSLSQRRTMVDAHGTVIAQLRHKKMDFVPTIYIGTPKNEKKVVLKSSGLLSGSSCNASISIDGEKVGKVEGDYRAENFSIQIDGHEIATLRRKRNTAHYGKNLAGADSYNISVTPPAGGRRPVDLAFVSLIAVAIDELYHWAIIDDSSSMPSHRRTKSK